MKIVKKDTFNPRVIIWDFFAVFAKLYNIFWKNLNKFE
jgi:hypothetical protein